MLLCSNSPNFTPWSILSALSGPSTTVAFKIDGSKEVADVGLLLSVTPNWCPSQWLPFVPQLRFKITTSRQEVLSMSSGSNPFDQYTLQAPQFTSTNVGMSTESSLLNERQLRVSKFLALVLAISTALKRWTWDCGSVFSLTCRSTARKRIPTLEERSNIPLFRQPFAGRTYSPNLPNCVR